MAQLPLPAVFNEYPTRSALKLIEGITHISIALKVARNIHMRCRLAEAQSWKCCWCGTKCIPESGKKHSATIEHVQPRSQGGADEWENFAMACSDCNQRRGVLSVEDMMAGNFYKRKSQRKSGGGKCHLAKRIRTGLKLADRGWVREDGTPICPEEWLASLKAKPAYEAKIRAGVFGEAA
jgi:hypothetical protein